MSQGLFIAGDPAPVYLLPGMANRHGLVAGATGTGKTVTLRVLAEQFSDAGVPVFLADIKGDLGGMPLAGEVNDRIARRVEELGLTDFQTAGFPTVFWDVFGENGHPVRTTVTEMGPLLLARLLQLNETQSSVLQVLFKLADEEGLLLLDLKDLVALVRHASANAKELRQRYGSLSTQSLGAIQRGLTAFEAAGGGVFFGEPALNLSDLLRVAPDGRGYVHILHAAKLYQSPRIYATVLLWLLAELFEQLPEQGDLEKPRLVFFFDEAHLLFSDLPKAMRERVEQIIRLIRSKGVGVFFVTQSPMDVPDDILGQLGNRIQHALRAFTPRDQKVVRASAQTFRQNADLNVETALTELAVGEAIVSLLDANGVPGVAARALIAPPRSRLGASQPEVIRQALLDSPVRGVYEVSVDRVSAYEMLKQQSESAGMEVVVPAPPARRGSVANPRPESPPARRPSVANPTKRRSRSDSPGLAMFKSTLRSLGTTLGRELARGIMGSLSKGKR